MLNLKQGSTDEALNENCPVAREGKAIDVRLRGVDTTLLRDTAKNLKLGGVGYYASSNFVHVDTGRVRYW